MPANHATTSSAIVHRNHATFELTITNTDSGISNFLLTIDRQAQHDVPFRLTFTREFYDFNTGEPSCNRVSLALTNDEFRQLLTMVTDFASTNGFTPILLPSPAP